MSLIYFLFFIVIVCYKVNNCIICIGDANNFTQLNCRNSVFILTNHIFAKNIHKLRIGQEIVLAFQQHVVFCVFMSCIYVYLYRFVCQPRHMCFRSALNPLIRTGLCWSNEPTLEPLVTNSLIYFSR